MLIMSRVNLFVCLFSNRRAKRGYLPVLQVILSCLLLVGCGSQLPEAYRHSFDGAPTSLDPAQSSSRYATFIITNLYDTLYRYKYFQRPYEVTPNLAAGMPEVFDDGMGYRITIRSGVRFIDDAAFPDGKGRELTAEDVIYSFLRHFDPATESRGAWLWRDRIVGLDDWGRNGADYSVLPEGLKAVDRYTFEIRLKRRFPQLLFTLTNAYSAIVPREAVEHYGSGFAAHPVGSGPYVLTEFNSERAVLKKSESYRYSVLHLDQEGYQTDVHPARYQQLSGHRLPLEPVVEIEFIEDDTVRFLALRREIDFGRLGSSYLDQTELLDEVRDRLYRVNATEPGIVYVGFNFKDPYLGDSEDPAIQQRNKALRCAITNAWNWDRRNRIFYGGHGTILKSIFPPGLREFIPRQRAGMDVPAAESDLQRSGWSAESFPELTFNTLSEVIHQQSYEEFRANMMSIGYPAEKVMARQFSNYGELNRAMINSEAQIFLTGWTLDYPDAENVAALFYGPNKAPGANKGSFINARYDTLYEQASVMPPSPERDQLYSEMENILIEECAGIFGITRARGYLVNRAVTMIPDELIGGFVLPFVVKD